MHFANVKSQLQKKRREFLMSELAQRSSSSLKKVEHSESSFRPLKSRMAPREYNSRQEQHDIDVGLVREIRGDKNYTAKWYVAADVHVGEMGVILKYIYRMSRQLFKLCGHMWSKIQNFHLKSKFLVKNPNLEVKSRNLWSKIKICGQKLNFKS